MKPAYNLYCDETRIDNPDSKRMVIGTISIPRKSKNEISLQLRHIFEKYNFCYELKWTKTGKKYEALYKELIDYFVNNKDLLFRCIIVDKSKLNFNKYHEGDSELAFFKFYYLMLRHMFHAHNNYYIFIDKKPTRDRNKARAFQSYLNSYIYFNKIGSSIKHLQAYDSHDNRLIQLADFYTGLIGYENNNPTSDSPKGKIVSYLKQRLGMQVLTVSTALIYNKFNIFVWEPKNG